MANNSDLKPETSLSPAALTVDLDGTSVWNAMSAMPNRPSCSCRKEIRN